MLGNGRRKMYILIILVVLTIIFLILRYTKVRYNEEDHILKIQKQNIEEIYLDNFSGKNYFNPWRKDERNFLHTIKWFFEKKQSFNYEKNKYLPKNMDLSIEEYKKIINSDKDFIIWIGHNTSLIKVQGELFLVDPIFADKIFSTKRESKVGLELDMLNELLKDKKLNILITHNHYDHFDIESLKKLKANGVIYAPKGISNLLKSFDSFEIKELNWWDEVKIGDLKLKFLPAQHYSHRIDQFKNKSLWGSFLIETSKEGESIFIGGDSGYFIGYKEYGRKFKIKYAVVPVGGYETRWFAEYEHLNVEESLEVMKDLKTEYIIPVHWGTYHLGVEPVDYTGYKYSLLFKENKNLENKVKLVNFGEIFYISVK